MKRYCKFCGKDITDTKFDKIFCGSIECRRKYDVYIRNKPKTEKFCVICGKNITHKHAKAKLCGDKKCQLEYNKIFYKNRQKTKICLDCNTSFEGADKKIYCDKCAKKRKENKVFQKIEKEVKCKYCYKIIKTIEKNLTKSGDTYCDCVCLDCKKLNKEKNSERMKIYNPMFVDGQTMKKEKKIMSPNEISIFMSNKMKLNNPMFNEVTRNKVRCTIKEKIKNGELTYKRGTENKNWIGNRDFNKHCRINLRKWVKEMFEENNYTCQKCNIRGGELHVHHQEPLRDIINIFLKKYNVTSTDIFNDEKQLNHITDEIVNYHFNNKKIGIVLCKKCHSIVDDKYNIFYNEN